jgi:hypothetical protein
MSNHGIVRKFFLDESEKQYHFLNVQDVEPILDDNKEDRSEAQTGDFRRVARIPNTILLQWYYEEVHKGNTSLQMYGTEFDEIIKRKLQDPDYAYLRTDKKPSIITGFMGFGS